MREIDFSEGLKSIDAQAFYGCESIESLDFPQSLESIGARAFEWCDGLADIAFAEGDTNRVAAKRVSIGERAFYNCLALEEVLLPQNLTAMGSRAFSQCDSLERINIPSNFTDIAESVFEDCAALATIEFPATLKSIGSTAFYGCTNLTGFLIPTQNVVTIGAKAFKNTKYWNDYPSDLVVNNGYILGFKNNPVDVTLPDGCKSIPVAMFEGMTSLKSVTIPDSVTEIGSRAFNGCTGLTNLVFTNVTTIGNSAFEGCSSLAAVTLSEGLKAIPGNCFKDCTSLAEILIPDSVATIGEYAFYNCASLVNVSGGAGVTQVGDYAFAQCPKMQPFELPNDVAYGDHVFQGCTWMEHVLFPSVGTLRDEYPATYANITSIVFSTTQTVITNDACAGCASLAYVRIPDGVKSLGARAFDGCVSLTSVVMSASVNEVATNAFRNCAGIVSATVTGAQAMQDLFPASYAKLVRVDFTEGVTSLCLKFLSDCTSISSIEIPATVTSIGSYAFQDCTGFETFEWPSGVGSIASGVFQGCTSLTSFAIPYGVTSVGSTAFAGCTSLASVTFSATVTSVASDAFNGCAGIVSATVTGAQAMQDLFPSSYAKLKRVDLTDGATSLCAKFLAGCAALPSFAVPATVTSIGSYAFQDCTGFETFEWPSGVGSIASGVFQGCTSLTSFAIPYGVTSVGSMAFAGCTALTTVTFSATVTSVSSDAFGGCTGIVSATVTGAQAMQDLFPASYENLKHVYFTDGVTSLCLNFLAGCTSISSVAIPETVTSIDSYAFQGCSNLSSISLPTGVTVIADSAFAECTRLPSIRLPDGVETVSPLAFDGCSSLESVVMSASVDEVATNAFRNCAGIVSATVTGAWPMRTLFPASYAKLTRIDFTDGVTSLCSNFMAGCVSVRSVALPETVGSIDRYAFQNCRKLTSFALPTGVTEVAEGTFAGCTALTAIDLPGGVTSVGVQAFDGCSALSELTMLASVTTVQSNAFRGCTSLTKLVVSGQFPLAPAFPETYGKLTGVGLATNATTLCDDLFSNCVALASVEIPWRVTTIGARTFYGCTGLADLVVPEFVDTIGDSAFARCKTLRSVGYLCEIPDSYATNLYAGAYGSLVSKVLLQHAGWQNATNSAGATTLPSEWCARPIAWWGTIQSQLAQIRFAYNTNWGGGTNLYFLADAGREIQSLPAFPDHPFNTNLVCLGWYTDSVGGTKVKAPLPVAGSATYYAHWGTREEAEAEAKREEEEAGKGESAEEPEEEDDEPAAELCQVTWNPNGGTVSPAVSQFDSGTTLRTVLNAAPTPKRTGWIFLGWYLDEDCLEPLDDTETLAETLGANMTFYADWMDRNDDLAAITFALPEEMTTGDEISDEIVDVSDSTTIRSVKVTGLPTGLKFTAKDVYAKGSKTEVAHEANTIYGTPSKSGVYTVVATVTTTGGNTASCSQTVVVRKDGQLVVRAEVALVDDAIEPIASAEIPGKVTGMGVYATGKKVTLRATANKGYVFAGWYDEEGELVSRAAAHSVTMGESDIVLTAAFVTTADDRASIDATVNGMAFPYSDDDLSAPEAIETNAYVGAYVEWPVAANALSVTTVKVSGLPTGLKFAASPVVTKTTTGTGAARKTTVVTNVPANTIYGTLTAASRTSKGVVVPSKVVVTVTTAGRNTRKFTINFTVLSLPSSCTGTFSGFALVRVNTNDVPTAADEAGWIALPCPFTATVNAKGALSGSLTAVGKRLSFKSARYAAYDASVSNLVYDVAIPLKTIDRLWTETLDLSLAIADGEATLAAPAASSPHLAVTVLDALRNAAKDGGYGDLAKSYKGTYVSTFDALMPDGVTTGLVTAALTVDAKGGVRAAGTFVDATTFSASATLAVEPDGRSATALIPATGKAFGSGGALLAFSFARDEAGSVALVALTDEDGPLSCAAKYVPKTNRAPAAYASYVLQEDAAYAYRANAWIGPSLETTDLLSVSYEDGTETVEALYAFTSKKGAVTGVGRTTNKAKLTLRINANTGLFTGTNGKTKLFGALYPAETGEATVSGCGSAVFATGAVAPVSVKAVPAP